MRFSTRVTAVAGVVAIGIAALLIALPLGSAAELPPPRAGDTTTPPSQAPRSRTGPGAGFTAHPLDVNGQVKEAAAWFVQRVGTWSGSEPPDPAALTAAAGYPADLAPTAGPLLDTDARKATTTIIYPQYGGLTGSSASVMVLARQVLRTADGDRTREVLLDVRVRRAADGTWAVTSTVDPPRPQIAPRHAGGPTALGRAVLDNPRIRIAGPGWSDITDRRVGDPILAVLDALARTHTLDVQVFVSGHPGTVFPTTRVSNHTVGRAVDVRAVDGRSVVGIPRDDPLITDLMVAAGRAGATEVGGPIAPAGRGFFTDDVHQDHFHLGITPTKPAAGP